MCSIQRIILCIKDVFFFSLKKFFCCCKCLSYCNIVCKKLYLTLWPLFLWMGFNYLKATVTSRRKFTFYHSVSRNTWYSFFRARKDERLSRPWSHPVVSSTGPLDWQSSALTTRPWLPFF